MDVDYSDDENFEVRVAPKKGGPKKTAARKPFAPSLADNGGGNGRSIEETYQKKTPLEHVLLRPDTYVGSVQSHTQPMWVYEGGQLVHREITFVPGLYKIFDEILVNAADNKQRDPSMDQLKVTVDQASNTISVWNNGHGIPVEIHAEEKCYVPELIFGHLLTSSNYDDTEKKTTGGRNGYGAKLANIFSTEFTIETADGDRLRKYKQVFRNNMSEKGDPNITKCKASDNWTRVSFKPDLAKFRLSYLDDDHVALMSKRVLDVAGVLGKSVKVELNGTRLPLKSFSDYVDLYLRSTHSKGMQENGEPLPKIYERVNEQWEVCVTVSDGQFQQVSFVNSIATVKGGTHVNYVADQLTKFLLEKCQKKAGKAAAGSIKAHQVKGHLWVFVNSLIVNPAFDSQTKETLNTRASEFGSTCKLPEDFLKKVASKCGIIESVLSVASLKASKDLKKTDGSKRQRLTGIAKLDDANDAGGRHSEDCTLILTEGDSAKALAVSGLAVVGRDRYGVFPLRGKLLNVRDATHKQIMDNAEISSIKQIMGLQQGKQYDSTKSLRYGHLMIMTDQDHDGSHIKGLLINFMHAFWPSLLKQPNFLLEFITPIVKATGPRGRMLSFYTMPEYEAWKESLGGSTKGWSVKYYKGLGTSTPKEAKEYFAALERHRKKFHWTGEEDGQHIEMAFSKKQADQRKNWLRGFTPGTYLDQSAASISYSDFVNKELILFSLADNMRSIPSVMDGLKPGQRKILFACFKRKLKADVKVAQLAGYISEHSAYHHGEQSLMSTIIGLAQDFVGSNNINLLVPSGQFGTRLQGGKDAASPRYIYTRLHRLARVIFPDVDDALLEYLNEDGQIIEPKWYVPILPMVLVNGSEGIGTGWSSSVPTYNPRDIVANLKALMAGEEMRVMQPWYRGFKGSVEESAGRDNSNSNGSKSYTVKGTISYAAQGGEGSHGGGDGNSSNSNGTVTVHISELPVRKWTQDYKEFLETMMAGSSSEAKDKATAGLVKDMREHHTDTTVHFEVQLSPEGLRECENDGGLLKKFKLTSSVSTGNMHLFDEEGRITKYESPEQIIKHFYGIRLHYYELRKEVQLEQLRSDLVRLDNRVRFILAVLEGDVVVSNRKKAELLAELRAKKFAPIKGKAGKGGGGKGIPGQDEEEAEEGSEDDEEEGEEEEEVEEKGNKGRQKKGSGSGSGGGSGYDYLLGMPLWSLTLERVQELLKEQAGKREEQEELERTEPKQLWERDLRNFLEVLEEVEVEESKEKAASASIASKGRKKNGSKVQGGRGGGAGGKGKAGGGGAGGKKKARRVEEGESELSDMEGIGSDEDDWDFAAAKPKPKASATAAATAAGRYATAGSKQSATAAGAADDGVTATAPAAVAGMKRKAAGGAVGRQEGTKVAKQEEGDAEKGVGAKGKGKGRVKAEEKDENDEPPSLMERLARMQQQRMSGNGATTAVATSSAAARAAPIDLDAGAGTGDEEEEVAEDSRFETKPVVGVGAGRQAVKAAAAAVGGAGGSKRKASTAAGSKAGNNSGAAAAAGGMPARRLGKAVSKAVGPSAAFSPSSLSLGDDIEEKGSSGDDAEDVEEVQEVRVRGKAAKGKGKAKPSAKAGAEAESRGAADGGGGAGDSGGRQRLARQVKGKKAMAAAAVLLSDSEAEAEDSDDGSEDFGDADGNFEDDE